MNDRGEITPQVARARFRAGDWTGPTTGFCRDYLQANLVIIPAAAADAFERYCDSNPAPCPLLERLERGDAEPKRLAPGADLRTDLPRYRVYSADGTFVEPTDVTDRWQSDAVGFLLGCSFSFEAALVRGGVPVRHIERGGNVSMYRTSRLTKTSEPFSGPLVVSMRPIPTDQVDLAHRITSRFPESHGAPVYHGDPAGIGIVDLARPEWGDAMPVERNEVPVFWACGVTSQVAVLGALARGSIPWAITHAPGHMFITDRPAASEHSSATPEPRG